MNNAIRILLLSFLPVAVSATPFTYQVAGVSATIDSLGGLAIDSSFLNYTPVTLDDGQSASLGYFRISPSASSSGFNAALINQNTPFSLTLDFDSGASAAFTGSWRVTQSFSPSYSYSGGYATYLGGYVHHNAYFQLDESSKILNLSDRTFEVTKLNNSPLYLGGGYFPVGSFPADNVYPVDSNNFNHLSFSVKQLSSVAASVPDDGTTLSLLGLALAGLAFVRRKTA